MVRAAEIRGHPEKNQKGGDSFGYGDDVTIRKHAEGELKAYHFYRIEGCRIIRLAIKSKRPTERGKIGQKFLRPPT